MTICFKSLKLVNVFFKLPKMLQSNSAHLCLAAVTLPRYTPHPYHRPNQDSESIKRNPTIRISRATRVMESSASLDREITNPKELRSLDEFLGNQVQ